MAAADDLADALAPPTDDALPDEFTIDSLERATWAVRRIAKHRARYVEAEEAACAERARITRWLESEQDRLERNTSHLLGLLRRYHEQHLADDPKARTIRTPAGDLVARKSPDRLDVDADVFVPWAEQVDPDLLRPPAPRAPDRRAIRARIGEVMSTGEVVDATTGAFLPGVVHVDGDVRFDVRVADADDDDVEPEGGAS